MGAKKVTKSAFNAAESRVKQGEEEAEAQAAVVTEEVDIARLGRDATHRS